MRRVATELGAGPMSLYRHVRDKDDLLLRMMLAQHDAEGFGACTNIGECAAAYPNRSPSTSSPSSTGTCTPPCATATDAMSNSNSRSRR